MLDESDGFSYANTSWINASILLGGMRKESLWHANYSERRKTTNERQSDQRMMFRWKGSSRALERHFNWRKTAVRLGAGRSNKTTKMFFACSHSFICPCWKVIDENKWFRGTASVSLFERFHLFSARLLLRAWLNRIFVCVCVCVWLRSF